MLVTLLLVPDDTDRDWESFARTDPYWSVLSAEEFRNKNLTAESLDRFFHSGKAHVESMLDILMSRFAAPKRFTVSLDFGCGVGRLLFPLAAVSEKSIGLDVSPTMLNLCRQHAEKRHIENIELYQSDDDLSAISRHIGEVEVITSYIVFQHISPRRGYRIFNNLLRLLKPGGVGCLHFTFAATIQSLQHEADNVNGFLYGYYQRTSDGIIKLVEYPAGDIQIQMNHYSLNELYCYLYHNGVSDILARLTNHSNTIGAELFFRKPG